MATEEIQRGGREEGREGRRAKMGVIFLFQQSLMTSHGVTQIIYIYMEWVIRGRDAYRDELTCFVFLILFLIQYDLYIYIFLCEWMMKCN